MPTLSFKHPKISFFFDVLLILSLEELNEVKPLLKTQKTFSDVPKSTFLAAVRFSG